MAALVDDRVAQVVAGVGAAGHGPGVDDAAVLAARAVPRQRRDPAAPSHVNDGKEVTRHMHASPVAAACSRLTSLAQQSHPQHTLPLLDALSRSIYAGCHMQRRRLGLTTLGEQSVRPCPSTFDAPNVLHAGSQRI